MSFSKTFFSELDLGHDAVAGVGSRILQSGRFPALFPGWMAQAYHTIRGTTPVLQHMLTRVESRAGDAFDVALAQFCRQKLVDEAGHDRMLRRDLVSAGIDPDEVERTMPQPALTALVGSQYYLIDFVHPAVYLGYIGLIEGYPPSLEDAKQLQKLSGAPKAAFATYRMHAAVDVKHREDLIQMLDQVPEIDWLRQAIIENALRSADFYCQALESLLDGDVAEAAAQ